MLSLVDRLCIYYRLLLVWLHEFELVPEDVFVLYPGSVQTLNKEEDRTDLCRW